MGLVERRIQDEFEKKRIPEMLKSYKEKTSGAIDKVTVQIDWATFGDNTAAYESLSSIWELPFYALEKICGDEIGREAIKKSLKKIVIKNVKAGAAFKAEYSGGVLTAHVDAAKGASGTPGWTDFQAVLEKAI